MKKHLIVIGTAVLLLVVGLSGCINKEIIEKEENEKPSVILTAIKYEGYCPFEAKFVCICSDDGEIVLWHCDFGDGTEENYTIIPEYTRITHTYNDTGTYTATLTVLDDDGVSEKDSANVIVRDKNQYMTVEEIYEEFNNSLNVKVNQYLFKILQEMHSSETTDELTIGSLASYMKIECYLYTRDILYDLNIPPEFEEARTEFNETLKTFSGMASNYASYYKYGDFDYFLDAVEKQNIAGEHWANCKEILGYE